ncbi:site-2 protease family protein [Actinomycetota bacterium Odt1-20B]
MKDTLSLGRIAGVRVGLHWSVLAIVVLVAVMLAEGRFPDIHPGYPALLYWALGFLASVLFLISLLAHELAHAVVAHRHDVQVDGITLWMLGGVARLRTEPSTPGAELRIAAAGPLTSALVGGLCTGVALGLGAGPASGLPAETFAWLAALNLTLAVFNALPAAPLDGGRLLHALLWHRTGDRLRATRAAAAAGRALGWFMLITGLGAVLWGNLSGLWPAFVGWFLIAASSAEAQQVELRSALNGIPVRQVMTRDLVTVPATVPLTAFLAQGLFGHYRHSAFPVLTPDGTVVGLVTVRLVNRTPVQARSTSTVADVMRPLAEVVTAAPDDPVLNLVPRLNAGKDHRALVLDDGLLVGIVTSSDISRALTWLTTATRPNT